MNLLKEMSRFLRWSGTQLNRRGPSHISERSLSVWIEALLPEMGGTRAVSPFLVPESGARLIPQAGTFPARAFQV